MFFITGILAGFAGWFVLSSIVAFYHGDTQAGLIKLVIGLLILFQSFRMVS